jgi:hypothetical protein
VSCFCETNSSFLIQRDTYLTSSSLVHNPSDYSKCGQSASSHPEISYSLKAMRENMTTRGVNNFGTKTLPSPWYACSLCGFGSINVYGGI